MGFNSAFKGLTSRKIARIVIGQFIHSSALRHQMALVVHVCEKLLHCYQVQWSKRMDKSRKMEGDYHGQRRTTWFLRKEGVTPSDIRRQLYAVCGQKTPARSTVFNWGMGFRQWQ